MSKTFDHGLTPLQFSGNYDRGVVGNVLQFSQGLTKLLENVCFRAIPHQDQAA